MSTEQKLLSECVSRPVDLRQAGISVAAGKCVGPDDDDDVRFEINAEVINSTDVEWHYLIVRTQILNEHGNIIDESLDHFEEELPSGDSRNIEIYLNSKGKPLGKRPEEAAVLLNVVACGSHLHDVGNFKIPVQAWEMTQFKPATIGDVVQLLNGGFWKTSADKDKESGVELKALIQNLTSHHLFDVRLLATVENKAGEEVVDAGGDNQIRGGDIALVSGAGYTKDKKLTGSNLSVSLRVYYPVATGVCQWGKFSRSDLND